MATELDTAGMRSALAAVVDDLGMRAKPEAARRGPLRRGRPTAPRGLVMSLVKRDGVVLVCEGLKRRGGLRRRSAPSFGLRGEVVDSIPLERLEKNQIGDALAKLDAKLTPARGLRRLGKNSWEPVAKPSGKRVLLFVHGTFSNCDNMLSELQATGPGTELLARITETYDTVLAFDHPTLGVSPVINARELALELGSISNSHIDVVCHSRGGLVTRWWLEGFDRGDPKKRRAVFLGSPLGGTGLAAPPNIRDTLSLLASISGALGKVAGAGAAAFPFLAVASGVFQVVRSVTAFVSKTPAVDAAIAMIPGLSAMSAVGNNHELRSLRRETPDMRDRYFVVKSNFEPEDPRWKFWRYFRASQLADTAADAIFAGENDLVVDTASMTAFSASQDLAIPATQVHDFGRSTTVHHTNYLRQEPALIKIQSWLK